MIKQNSLPTRHGEQLRPKTGRFLYQDLSDDESLTGQPGDWLVRKNIFMCMQSQNFKKYLILKF